MPPEANSLSSLLTPPPSLDEGTSPFEWGGKD
jgi:hypothetical protein